MAAESAIFNQALGSIRSSITADRLAQAYLVIGSPQGDALHFTEQILLSLYCENDGSACGTCRTCRLAARRAHPDVQWIEPQKKSRRIAIEQIRNLEEYVYQTSFSGGWKVGILIDADRIGVEAANAFLKTLEEPPPRCLFLLLARNAHALPATVVSRCQRVVLSSEVDALPEEWREPLLNMLCDVTGQSPTSRTALSSRIESLLKVIHDAAEEEVAEGLTEESREESKDTITARVEARYKMYRATVLQMILLWQRDVLLHVCDAPPKALHFQDRVEDTARQAGGLDYRVAMQRVHAAGRIESLLESNLPEAAVLRTAFRH